MTASESIQKHFHFSKKILAIRQEVFSPTDSYLATSHNNIGMTYYEMSDHRKALPLYERALDIFQRSVPFNYPNLLAVKEVIDFLYTIS
jgi:tetratricopeptide (TPR) repeat protein